MDVDNIVSQLIEEISKEWRETGYFGDARSDPGMVYAVARRFGEDLEGKLARIEHLEKELAKYENMEKEATSDLKKVAANTQKPFRPCLHDKCSACHGTYVRDNGTRCVHYISCSCPRCSNHSTNVSY